MSREGTWYDEKTSGAGLPSNSRITHLGVPNPMLHLFPHWQSFIFRCPGYSVGTVYAKLQVNLIAAITIWWASKQKKFVLPCPLTIEVYQLVGYSKAEVVGLCTQPSTRTVSSLLSMKRLSARFSDAFVMRLPGCPRR